MSGVRVPPRPPLFPLVLALRLVDRVGPHERVPAENPRDGAVLAGTGRYGGALGERIEAGQHGRLVALEQVPIAIEDDGDGGVPGPGGDQQQYYLDTVARGAEEYYTGAKEAPGQWLGAGSGRLGLAGEVDADALGRVLEHVDPATGTCRLTAAKSAPVVAGFDATGASTATPSTRTGSDSP